MARRPFHDATVPPSGYHSTIALNIKDPETERLAGEVAALAGETKTRAVKTALKERKERLAARVADRDRVRDLTRFLADEVWPRVPPDVLGKPLPKSEREAILGYGPQGH